jgi:hypothetical protein
MPRFYSATVPAETAGSVALRDLSAFASALKKARARWTDEIEKWQRRDHQDGG